MTAELWLRNLGSFAIQAVFLVAAGVAIWRTTGVRHGAVSHAYWRALLVAALLLPLAQPWRTPPPLEIAAKTTVINEESRASGMDPAGAVIPASRLERSTSTSQWVLIVLAAGVAVRALWLCIGAASLRRLRRSALPVDPPTPGIRDALAIVGVHAAVRTSPRVAGPITFGFRRPLVILPPEVLALDDALQAAIVSHELVHVRRRDWLHVIAEEMVRTILWFHPAIWWLINRIQLSREHLVDEAVVALTKSRARYVEAMLAVALARSPLAFAPAPHFLRRRSLRRRVAHLLQETTMTTRRLLASVAVTAGTLLATAVLVVRVFPLEAQAQGSRWKTQGSAPIEIASGGEHLLHGSLAGYPRRAIEQRVEGEVVVDLTIDDRGEVSDARVLSGPEELRRAALESVLQWHYAPDKLRSTSAQAVLRFTVPDESEQPIKRVIGTLTTREPDSRQYAITFNPTRTTRDELADAEFALHAEKISDAEKERMEVRLIEKTGAEADRAPRPALPFSRIRTDRVPAAVVQALLARSGLKTGDPVTADVRTRVAAAAKSLDEHFHVRFEPDGQGGLVLVIIAP